ncbi:calcification-associated peptide-2 [Penaeus vannamei]|uniref:Calcification-associated peptide-2 n=2 Tax=Penaeus vannamei TaxID=6689 RepID=A0A3R7M133_PENVA|nr:calcification-associated peptide-2 [Penaeus vannamei]
MDPPTAQGAKVQEHRAGRGRNPCSSRPRGINCRPSNRQAAVAPLNLASMKVLVLFALGLVALAAARPSDIIDFEEDHMEHEQEGIPGTAVEGEYSWVAPDGNEYHVKYVADRFGYRIVDDNVVPRMRSDAPEAEEDDD